MGGPVVAQNPYRGQPEHAAYEHAWDVGYHYGYEHPHESDYPSRTPGVSAWGPMDSQQISWLDQVWSEGALEGQKDGLQYGHDVTVNPAHSGGGEGPSLTEAAVHVGGHGVVEAGVHLAEFADGGVPVLAPPVSESLAALAAGFAEGVLIGALIFLITATEDPDVAHTEPHELGPLLARKCADANCSEFFLPYCTATSGHGGGSDGIFQAGLWHGPMYYNQENAQYEAYQHLINERHWNHTGVVHYLASAPNEVDWMVLVAQHAS
jgi:hypothetical protein